MKNSHYIIALLLVIIWGIIFWGFEATGAVHLILVAAAIVAITRLVKDKKLVNKDL